MRIRVVIAAVVLFAAAGCTSDPDPVGAPPSSSQSPEPEVSIPDSLVLEGPASAGASWPDGLSARLTAVERVPADWSSEASAQLAIVRITVEVSNGTGEVLPLPTGVRELAVQYGPTRVEAEQAAGFSYPDRAEDARKALNRDAGTRLPANGKGTFVESALVPVSALGDVTVVVTLPAAEGYREPFTLTGVGGLLKTVK